MDCVASVACQPCPAGTEPVLGYEYKWWNVLPANMKTSCFNVANNNCDGLNGERLHEYGVVLCYSIWLKCLFLLLGVAVASLIHLN